MYQMILYAYSEGPSHTAQMHKLFWSSLCIYSIRPNYRTYPYKGTVKQFLSLQVTASVLFCLLFYKGICCRYPFDLHQLVDAIQMSTHNICFYEENQKEKSHKHHQVSLLLIFFKSVPFAGPDKSKFQPLARHFTAS